MDSTVITLEIEKCIFIDGCASRQKSHTCPEKLAQPVSKTVLPLFIALTIHVPSVQPVTSINPFHSLLTLELKQTPLRPDRTFPVVRGMHGDDRRAPKRACPTLSVVASQGGSSGCYHRQALEKTWRSRAAGPEALRYGAG